MAARTLNLEIVTDDWWAEAKLRAVDVDCFCTINFCVWSPSRQKGRLETEEENWRETKKVF